MNAMDMQRYIDDATAFVRALQNAGLWDKIGTQRVATEHGWLVIVNTGPDSWTARMEPPVVHSGSDRP